MRAAPLVLTFVLLTLPDASAQLRAYPLEGVSRLTTSFGTLSFSPPLLTLRASDRQAALGSSQFRSFFSDLEAVSRKQGWGSRCVRPYVLARQNVTPARLEAAADAYHRSLSPLLRAVFGSRWVAFNNELGAGRQMVSAWRTARGTRFVNLLTYAPSTRTLLVTACELG